VKLLVYLVGHTDKGVVAFGKQNQPVKLTVKNKRVVVAGGDVLDVWRSEPIVVISVG
jgi:hypothetical protein